MGRRQSGNSSIVETGFSTHIIATLHTGISPSLGFTKCNASIRGCRLPVETIAGQCTIPGIGPAPKTSGCCGSLIDWRVSDCVNDAGADSGPDCFGKVDLCCQCAIIDTGTNLVGGTNRRGEGKSSTYGSTCLIHRRSSPCCLHMGHYRR